MVTIDKITKELDADISKHKEFLVELGKKHYHYDVKFDYFKV